MPIDPSTRDKSGRHEVWLPFIDSMKVAIAHFDEEGLEETYREALSSYTVGEVTRHLLIPLLVELGKRWETVESGIAEEHFFAFYIRNILGERFGNRSRSSNEDPILLAGFPGESHEIAMLLFALAADSEGLPVLVLGANIPLSQVALAAEKRRFQAIVLSCVVEPSGEVLNEDLAALVNRSQVPVFIGGTGAVIAQNGISRIGAICLGEDIDRALKRLREVLVHSTADCA